VLAADLESRLEEWSRWARAYGRRRGSCGSIENHWRSPQHWTELTFAPQMPIIATRAYQVELVVAAMQDPWRSALVLHYVRQMPAPIQRRRLRRWNVRDVPALLNECRQRVADALVRGDRRIGRAAVA